MVIGLLAIAAIPTVTGVGQAISAQKKQNAAAKEQEKFRLSAILEVDGSYREACFCVLKDGKVCAFGTKHYQTPSVCGEIWLSSLRAK